MAINGPLKCHILIVKKSESLNVERSLSTFVAKIHPQVERAVQK